MITLTKQNAKTLIATSRSAAVESLAKYLIDTGAGNTAANRARGLGDTAFAKILKIAEAKTMASKMTIVTVAESTTKDSMEYARARKEITQVFVEAIISDIEGRATVRNFKAETVLVLENAAQLKQVAETVTSGCLGIFSRAVEKTGATRDLLKAREAEAKYFASIAAPAIKTFLAVASKTKPLNGSEKQVIAVHEGALNLLSQLVQV